MYLLYVVLQYPLNIYSISSHNCTIFSILSILTIFLINTFNIGHNLVRSYGLRKFSSGIKYMCGPSPSIIRRAKAKYKNEHKFAQLMVDDNGIEVASIINSIKYRISLMLKSPLFRGIYLDSLYDISPRNIENSLKNTGICVMLDGYVNSINFKKNATLFIAAIGGFGKWEFHMRNSIILAHYIVDESDPIIQNKLIDIMTTLKELNYGTVPVHFKNNDYQVKINLNKIPIKFSGMY